MIKAKGFLYNKFNICKLFYLTKNDCFSLNTFNFVYYNMQDV